MQEKTAIRSSPLLDDRPSTEDRLGFETYAIALEEVIVNPQAKTPFIIGIFGRWGTGKTTLMRILEHRLAPRAVVAPIWFSAWTYGADEEIGAAFLQNLIGQISRRLRMRDQIRFSLGLLNRGLAWDRLPLKLPAVLIQIVLVMIPVLLGVIAAKAAGPAAPIGVALGSIGAGASVLAAWQFLKPLVLKVGTLPVPGQSLYRELDFEAHVGILSRFREQFARMVDSLPEGSARVVIFIDDLDRCEPEKALQLLDVIKVFLDVPRCIFVVGVDISIVQRALQRRYPDDPVAQREYLSKIVQLPFHLPLPTKAELRAFVTNLDVKFPDDRCGEVFLGSVAHNPREIKRLINIYGLNWYLAQAKAGSEITPVRLAKIVVIQQAFEALFTLLRDRPDWLALLERAMRRITDPAPSEPPGADEATVIIGPSGVAIPPAIAPFLDNAELRDLLTLHPLQDAGQDDANFAGLQPDEIGLYFNFARRVPMAGGSAPDLAASVDPAAPEPFPFFSDRYRVVARAGSGGISEVFMAQDLQSGRQVAIKRLHVTLARDSEWLRRFHREIGVLQRVGDHPNIVRFIEFGSSPNGDPFCVLEDAGATSLDTILQSGPLGPSQRRSLLLPMFSALGHIHAAGIIHGDIKPSSIVVDRAGQARLVDFGLAFLKAEESSTVTMSGDVLATLAYASPEQIKGGDLDPRSDLFSLGVVVYQSIFGQRPFEGDSFGRLAQNIITGHWADPASTGPALTPALKTFLDTILNPDPAGRFENARAAGQAFAAALADPAQA